MFIVIECWPDADNAAIVTNEDGTNKTFVNIRDAQAEADDCQNGFVIEIN